MKLFQDCKLYFLLQITNLRSRGMEFLHVPDTYYINLRKHLKLSGLKVFEDLDMIQVTMNIIFLFLVFFSGLYLCFAEIENTD